MPSLRPYALTGIRHLWHKHIRRGVSALLVQLYRAMRRPRSVERADDSKNFHALFIYTTYQQFIICPLGSNGWQKFKIMEIFYFISITTVIILFISLIIINLKIKHIRKQKEINSNQNDAINHNNISTTKKQYNMGTNSFSNNLYEIAESLIISCNLGDKQIAENNMITLYKATEGKKSKLLLQINPKQAGTIGLGYTWFTFLFNNGNSNINDIAAENALFCLTTNYIETNNCIVLPAIFSLLNKCSEHLEDTINRTLRDTFYYAPTNDRGHDKYNIDGTKFYKYTIMFFCLNNFYDLKAEKFKIKDLPFQPNIYDVKRFMNEFTSLALNKLDNICNIGENNLRNIQNSIRNFLIEL